MFSIMAYLNRMLKIVKLTARKLLGLNIFLDSTTLEEQNHRKIRDQVLATRLYFLLFITSLAVLVLFNSLTTKIISVTVFEPSLDTYDRLYITYPNTLSCLCKRVSMQYNSFISMEYVQHPVKFSAPTETTLNHSYIEKDPCECFVFNIVVNFISNDIRIDS